MPLDLTGVPEIIIQSINEMSPRISFDYAINKGANGYVFKGQNRILNRSVVVKCYFWGDGAHAEPRLLSELASENLLQVDDAAPIDAEYAYFVTPFCENGDLDRVIERRDLGVHQALSVFMDIANGVSYIHGKGYLHRDLKPSNIFCQQDGKTVIGDFGSVVKKGELGYAETGSRHSLLYRTPEEINTGRAYEQGDIYQLGIVLYQMLGGSLPYEEDAWLSPAQKVEQGNLPYPDNQLYASAIIQERIEKGRLLDLKSLPPWCSHKLVATIRKCCRTDPNRRIESASALDWRQEPYPVLYHARGKLRIVESKGLYCVEKMASSGTSWRKVRAISPCSLKDAVIQAEKLY